MHRKKGFRVGNSRRKWEQGKLGKQGNQEEKESHIDEWQRQF